MGLCYFRPKYYAKMWTEWFTRSQFHNIFYSIICFLLIHQLTSNQSQEASTSLCLAPDEQSPVQG